MPVQYQVDFKKNAVRKLLSKDSSSIVKVAEDLGIPPSTLYGWKATYAKTIEVETNLETKEILVSKPSYKLSREQKLNFIIKTSSMSEDQLGIFLRENGLHSSDLVKFKEEILNGPKESKKPSVDPEVTKLRRDMEKQAKELKRKDKALAELSARVVLLKKSHEIWGMSEEDE